MTKRRQILILLAFGLLVAVLYAIISRPREPSYGGHTLSHWVEAYGQTFAHPASVAVGPVDAQNHQEQIQNAQRQIESGQAIRCIGTNAVPYLLAWSAYEEPAWRKKLRQVLNDLPSPFNRIFALGDQRTKHAKFAYDSLRALGPLGKQAIPVLAQRLQAPGSSHARGQVLSALAFIGKDSIPCLQQALTNRETVIRFYALNITSILQSNATPLVPLLIQNLTDPVRSIRATAAGVLGNLELRLDLVVPALKAALKDPDPAVHQAVTKALLKIAPEALTNAPPK